MRLVILTEEAAEIGLVNRAVPADSLMKEARALAAMMTKSKPESRRREARPLTRTRRS